MFTTNPARSAAASMPPVNQNGDVEIELHGYHPDDVRGEVLERIVREVWEMGAKRVRLIHGHGRGRGIIPGFVNTNTGFFGLRIRGQLRTNERLHQWIMRSTIDRSDAGSTTVRLKPNPAPTRTDFDDDVFPKSSVSSRGT